MTASIVSDLGDTVEVGAHQAGHTHQTLQTIWGDEIVEGDIGIDHNEGLEEGAMKVIDQVDVRDAEVVRAIDTTGAVEGEVMKVIN